MLLGADVAASFHFWTAPYLQPKRRATFPTSMGARKPPTLLEAVHTPHTVPRSVSDHQVVMMRAQAGAPRPCKESPNHSTNGQGPSPFLTTEWKAYGY